MKKLIVSSLVLASASVGYQALADIPVYDQPAIFNDAASPNFNPGDITSFAGLAVNDSQPALADFASSQLALNMGLNGPGVVQIFDLSTPGYGPTMTLQSPNPILDAANMQDDFEDGGQLAIGLPVDLGGDGGGDGGN